MFSNRSSAGEKKKKQKTTSKIVVTNVLNVLECGFSIYIISFGFHDRNKLKNNSGASEQWSLNSFIHICIPDSSLFFTFVYQPCILQLCYNHLLGLGGFFCLFCGNFSVDNRVIWKQRVLFLPSQSV